MKNSRGESHQSEWYSKSENVGKIHCNKEIESLGGFLPTTGSFKYIKIDLNYGSSAVCVTIENLLTLSEPHFPIYKSEDLKDYASHRVVVRVK